MNSSGITGTDAFVMQDATKLIKNTGLRRVAGAITDVAALGERAILGHERPSVSAGDPSVGRNDLVCTCGKQKKKPRKRNKKKKTE